MRNLFMTAALATCLMALSATAQEQGRKELTPEQKKARKEMVGKYDTNGDGKIDKDERSKMSDEDKAKMREMNGGKRKKPKGDGGSNGGDQ
jgi:hypothetical protein